jgi:putative redox protein
MRVVARRRSGYAHEVETDTGHTVVIDEPADEGGNDEGPQPTRMLCAGLAACTAITVEMYADRKGWDVGDLEVEVEADLVGTSGGSSTFNVLLKLPEALDAGQVERLLTVAAKCPVHRALKHDVEFIDRVERV